MSNAPLRKHRKTSSGCWTCRARKVKCDEERPACRQCRRGKRECEGYQVRLRWVINNDPLGADLPEHFAVLEQPQRSKMALNPNLTALPEVQVEEILATLDKLESWQDHGDGTDATLVLSGFGAFRIGFESSDSSRQGSESSRTPPATSVISPAGEQAPFGPLSLPFLSNDDASSAYIRMQHRAENASHLLSGQVANIGFSEYSCCEPLNLSSVEKFLINHYSSRVVALFCVVDNEKSPWRTIYLPKALQAAGQLGLTGTTSTIRKALLCALLAVSAFCLFNDRKSQLRATGAVNWKAAAVEYRCKAIELLKDAVEHDLDLPSRPKYKDFLATMLSMVTINVISGDIDSCGVHLDGASRLIHHARSWKNNYSGKAQALHRQYLYLQAIYNSTSPRGRQRAHSFPYFPMGFDISYRDLLQEHPVKGVSRTQRGELHFAPRKTIYGVPCALLLLLTRVIDLLNKLYDAQAQSQGVQIPSHLVTECDELESSILEWRPDHDQDKPPSAISDSIPSTNARIVRHQTIAFHNALVIYFAQHIRLLSHRFLRPYVASVLENIEAIARMKIESNILAAPLYWPTFIAASEAFDPALQERFRRWHEHMDVYGIEALRTGMDVVEEVWRAGPRSGNRTTSYWRAIVEDSMRTLMLC
ncbi:Zn(II)2Cys6 transcription factor [Aspergillus stella-maris]|uniref:Zn(II)2Cys6 transcription factor n=1 Tax=Aspergillus stella-maris TaxID=1810926 RepID=UPI003CCD147B